jgi:hypothetical protein
MSFEQTASERIAQFDPIARAARKGSGAVLKAGKMLADGDIRSISKRLSEAEEELFRAAEGIRGFWAEWDEARLEEYFGSEEYISELIACLDEQGIDQHRVGDVLYVYPVLVRFDVNARTVRIDKKIETRVRPQVLAGILSDIQNRPTRFPTGRFLNSLFRVYKALGSHNLPRTGDWAGKSMFLRDIYEMLSASPGSDYSEQEFVRDIYLLDASGEPLEVRGYIASFQQSSGTKDDRRTMSIITRDGQRRLYCSIRFDPIAR